MLLTSGLSRVFPKSFDDVRHSDASDELKEELDEVSGCPSSAVQPDAQDSSAAQPDPRRRRCLASTKLRVLMS